MNLLSRPSDKYAWMLRLTFGMLFTLTSLQCTSGHKGDENQAPVYKFTLEDFFGESPVLDSLVNQYASMLSDEEKVGQLIVPAAGRLGKPDSTIVRLIKEKKIGGVLLLNGSVESFKQKTNLFDSLANKSGLSPLVYSADAEPSLINRKIENSVPVPKTIDIPGVAACDSIATLIAEQLKEIGILYNYAPVADQSPNNEAIGNRSFGNDPIKIMMMSQAFINGTQKAGVVATAKHFPGHGLVQGDSHSKLVYIDGTMEELPLFTNLMENGVLSVMVGHIAIKNNEQYDTDGLPASCSRIINQQLIRNDLGYEGLIVTDAMNMGAVSLIPNADFLALTSGVDIVLMPKNEDKLIRQAVDEMSHNPAFRKQVETSLKRVLRMKYCLNLLQSR